MKTTLKDLRYFELARAAAATSSHKKALIGAVIVQGKDIASIGINGCKSHPLQREYNRLRFDDESAKHEIHAELDAIVRAKGWLIPDQDSRIYVYRMLKSGEPGMCRPCPGCMKALRDHNILNVFYSTNDEFIHEVIK